MTDVTAEFHQRQQVVDGETVRRLEHGTGSPVVLVHGIPTSPRLWHHVLPLLPPRQALTPEEHL